MFSNFSQLIQQKLEIFSPFTEKEVIVKGNIFSKKQQKVSDFVQEITDTAQLLAQQTNEDYADFYATKLLRQFDSLNQAVLILKKSDSSSKEVFVPSFSFSKNIHALPSARRLNEYRKALRALNEKISWLLEKSYAANENEKIMWQQQVEETEYRKMKCLKAIEDLEEKLSKN
ncbi:primosomal replication protein PriC [Actinobacillus genomosp. 1]|uniref:primosomal replication protein PriC n=1 Tax=Actinobacillus genomosp. 1 TaxID=254839 RepID=UPI002441775D|nr:primosomal replication protein PriC [Actinobacillus genomosp. 1]WGE92000.1 primosomal replication protein [Actinobacillus genomosp. 1]